MAANCTTSASQSGLSWDFCYTSRKTSPHSIPATLIVCMRMWLDGSSVTASTPASRPHVEDPAVLGMVAQDAAN